MSEIKCLKENKKILQTFYLFIYLFSLQCGNSMTCKNCVESCSMLWNTHGKIPIKQTSSTFYTRESSKTMSCVLRWGGGICFRETQILEVVLLYIRESSKIHSFVCRCVFWNGKFKDCIICQDCYFLYCLAWGCDFVWVSCSR